MLDILEKVYFNNETSQLKASFGWGCGLSLAGNFVSTQGLAACATGVGCPVAIAAKVLALASVAASCL